MQPWIHWSNQILHNNDIYQSGEDYGVNPHHIMVLMQSSKDAQPLSCQLLLHPNKKCPLPNIYCNAMIIDFSFGSNVIAGILIPANYNVVVIENGGYHMAWTMSLLSGGMGDDSNESMIPLVLVTSGSPCPWTRVLRSPVPYIQDLRFLSPSLLGKLEWQWRWWSPLISLTIMAMRTPQH